MFLKTKSDHRQKGPFQNL